MASEIVSIEHQGDENKVPEDQYKYKYMRKTKSGNLLQEIDEDITKECLRAAKLPFGKDGKKTPQPKDEEEE